MKPTHQTILSDESRDIFGNCFSAVLASLLHIPLKEIPVFKGDNWQVELNQWLRPLGLAYVQMLPSVGLKEVGIDGLYHETSSEGHACVAIDGEVVFDPDPAVGRFVGINHYKAEAVGLFVALRPWELLR